jgi:hypothetical protein
MKPVGESIDIEEEHSPVLLFLLCAGTNRNVFLWNSKKRKTREGKGNY